MRLLKYADQELIDMIPIFRIAESGLATVSEIEEKWTLLMQANAIEYLEMKSDIESRIREITEQREDGFK